MKNGMNQNCVYSARLEVLAFVQQQTILSLEFQSNSSDGESNIESARASETASKISLN